MPFNALNPTVGLLLVNDEGHIVYCNKAAGFFIPNVSEQGDHIDSILNKSQPNFYVERIDLEQIQHTRQNIKYIYLLIARHKNLWKKILENCHDEIFVTDGNGIVVYCNEVFEKFYGIKRSEIIGKKGWGYLNTLECTQSPIPIVMKKKKEITVEQITYTGRKVVITATPVFNKKGDIELIIENGRDITEIQNITYDVKQAAELTKTKELVEQYKMEVNALRKRELDIYKDLKYSNKKMKDTVDVANKIAKVDSTVLLLGESGTGKTLLAKYIHKMSRRKDGPFITINCATIPESLLESELFGYASGAFTGAKKDGKIGLAELANNGTLFLDEIGEIPINLQPKFLELIQEHLFTPVGGVSHKKVDIRVIAATNRDLSTLVEEKKFREDLYYRLKVVELDIPPLRERPEDILTLTYYFLNKYDKKYNFSHKFSQESLEILTQYSWPGNIRELKHVIEGLVVTAPDRVIAPWHLPKQFYQVRNAKSNIVSNAFMPLDLALEQVERELICKAYKQYGSSYKVAEVLKISQSKASRKIRKYIKNCT